MKYKLNQNLEKDMWHNDSIDHLFSKLELEIAELCTEVKLHDYGTEDLQAKRLENIILECADVANFAMFIADIADMKKMDLQKRFEN